LLLGVQGVLGSNPGRPTKELHNLGPLVLCEPHTESRSESKFSFRYRHDRQLRDSTLPTAHSSIACDPKWAFHHLAGTIAAIFAGNVIVLSIMQFHLRRNDVSSEASLAS
jgi:hypothetical protein